MASSTIRLERSAPYRVVNTTTRMVLTHRAVVHYLLYYSTDQDVPNGASVCEFFYEYEGNIAEGRGMYYADEWMEGIFVRVGPGSNKEELLIPSAYDDFPVTEEDADFLYPTLHRLLTDTLVGTVEEKETIIREVECTESMPLYGRIWYPYPHTYGGTLILTDKGELRMDW